MPHPKIPLEVGQKAAGEAFQAFKAFEAAGYVYPPEGSPSPLEFWESDLLCRLHDYGLWLMDHGESSGFAEWLIDETFAVLWGRCPGPNEALN